jgi:putative oxidoreductase
MTETAGSAISKRTPLGRSGLAVACLRVALGAGFVSAVADRLGLWGLPGTLFVSWGNFHNFLTYTAKLNPWCLVAYLPLLGEVVTIAEAGLGILLILGLFTRMASLLTGVLSLVFAIAMTSVLGIHAPLNYSVFVFSAASFLLASQPPDGLSLDRFRGVRIRTESESAVQSQV